MDFSQDIQRLIEGNLPIAFVFAFGSGFVTSLTPCVYPVIGITVAIFGAMESKSRLQAFALSATFVAGLATMYTALGIVAGLTGMLFGSLMSNPWVIGTISVIFLVLSLGMFGVYEMQMPEALRERASRAGGSGWQGALVMGLVSGVVAAPCAGPMVSGILAYVGTVRSPILGGLLLLAYSLGMGILFLLVGTFAMSLPKSGKWLDGVKDVLGSTLIVIAGFFAWGAFSPLRGVFPKSHALMWAGAGASVAGVVLVALAHSVLHEKGRGATLAARIPGITLSVAGAILAVWSILAPEPVTLSWRGDLVSALAEARESGKPAVVDFTAEWCNACKELEKITFSDPAVAGELERFVRVRADMTEADDANDAIMAGHGVKGLPTVILFDAAGKEATRFTRFVKPPMFLDAARKVR